MNRQDANMDSENIQYRKLITKHTSNVPPETYFLPSIFLYEVNHETVLPITSLPMPEINISMPFDPEALFKLFLPHTNENAHLL